MRKALLFSCAVLALFACTKPQPEPEPEPEPVPEEEPAEPITINVASFNIRLATTADTDYKSWASRKENCAAVIKNHDFDVVGFQEVLAVQQTDLKNLLPDYSFYFVGRDTGISGEAVGVAWKKADYELMEWDRFWLSATPDKPSSSLSWGGMSRNRVASWVLLRHKASGKEFYFLATHLEVDNNGTSYADIRAKSAELIVERMNGENSRKLPLFIVGDMNPASDDEEALGIFRAAFSDSFREAESKGVRQGPKGTYQAFDPNRNLDKASSHPFDFIFHNEAVELLGFSALTDKFGGYYPSDHLPVTAKVSF